MVRERLLLALAMLAGAAAGVALMVAVVAVAAVPVQVVVDRASALVHGLGQGDAWWRDAPDAGPR